MHIAVYCSAADNLPRPWQQAAEALGAWIGQHDATLVYGGVDAGLMAVVARAAKEAGAKIAGIVPMRRKNSASPLNDVLVPTSDLNDRKGVMQMLGDAFVVLPGGYGTLDEFTTSFSYLNFTGQDKPIVIFNPDNLFDHLLAQLHVMAERGLMDPAKLEKIHVATDVDTMLTTLENALTTVK